MSISCLMITTNKASRLEMTKQAITSIEESAECEFKEKVLSIDIIDDDETTLGLLRQHATSRGWITVSGPCSGYRGMVNNMWRGLEHITSDKLFYCEDHVIIEQVPKESVITKLFEETDNRWVQWICYNTHIVEQNLLNVPGFVEKPDVNGVKKAYINSYKNYECVDCHTFLIKGEELKDEYYINFPAAITTSKIFRLILTEGCQHFHDVGVEVGFTKAWFGCRLANRFDVAVYVKPDILKDDDITFGSIHHYAQMRFRNNDKSMLHASINKHDDLPEDKNKRNAFF